MTYEYKLKLLPCLMSGALYFDVRRGDELRVIIYKPAGGRHQKVAEVSIAPDAAVGEYAVQEVSFDAEYRLLTEDRYYTMPLRGSDSFVLLSDGGERVALMLGKRGGSRLMISVPGGWKAVYSAPFEEPRELDAILRRLDRLSAMQEELVAALRVPAP